MQFTCQCRSVVRLKTRICSTPACQHSTQDVAGRNWRPARWQATTPQRALAANTSCLGLRCGGSLIIGYNHRRPAQTRRARSHHPRRWRLRASRAASLPLALRQRPVHSRQRLLGYPLRLPQPLPRRLLADVVEQLMSPLIAQQRPQRARNALAFPLSWSVHRSPWPRRRLYHQRPRPVLRQPRH